MSDSGHALGLLLAAVANLSMAPTIVLTGEGVRLADVARAQMLAGLAQGRDPQAGPVDLRVTPVDYDEWARGAAAAAVQAFTGRSRRPAALRAR